MRLVTGWKLLGAWGTGLLFCVLLRAPMWQGAMLVFALEAMSFETTLIAMGSVLVGGIVGHVLGEMHAAGTLALAGLLCGAVLQPGRDRLANTHIVWANMMGRGFWIRDTLYGSAMALVGAAAIRGIPVFPVLLLAAICCLAARALPKNEERGPHHFWGTLALLIGSVAIAVFLMEGAARVLLVPRPARQIHEPNADYIFRLRPNTVAQQSIRLDASRSRLVEIRLSSQGFRDREYGPKTRDEFRILLLGDSFAMGFAVEEKDSIARQLERLLANENLPKRVSVVNAGMTGAGPWQEWGILRDRGIALNPDAVILQLCTVNDIDNSLEYVGKRQRAYYRNWQVLLEMLRHMEHPAVRAEYAVQRHSRLYREIWFQTGLCSWIIRLGNACRGCPVFAVPGIPPSENRPNEIEIDLREWYPDLYVGMAVLESFVVEIRDLCRANKTDLAAFSIPPSADIDADAWLATTKTFNPYMYEQGKGVRLFDELLRRNDIPVFSVVETLRNHKPIDEIYYAWDGHLTERGNELVAETIRDFVLERYFPNRATRQK